MSTAARYGNLLGISAVLLVCLGAGSAALQLLPAFRGFLLMVLGLGLALVGLVMSIVGLVATGPSKNREGRSQAIRGLVICLAIIGLIAVPASRGRGVPRINDITTDTDDPPVFVTAAAAEANVGRDMAYPGASFIEQQREGYPDLASLVLEDSPDKAFDRARDALGGMPRIQITGEDRKAGRIEATETSSFFHFSDDVVVRIRLYQDGGSRVDVRSKSRDGKGDMGVNAARIRTLFARIRGGGKPDGN